MQPLALQDELIGDIIARLEDMRRDPIKAINSKDINISC